MLNHQLNPIGHSGIDLTYDLTNTDCSTYDLTSKYITYVCFTVLHRTKSIDH